MTDLAALAQALRESLRAAQVEPGAAALGLSFALVALLPLAVVVPMTLVCLAVAARLPAAPAALVILAGAGTNTALAWILARTVFGARVEQWLQRRGGWLGAVREGALREPLKWSFLARYVPAPFVAAPMVLSAAGVGLGTTLWGSLLGMAPWTAVYVYAARAGTQDSVTGFSRAAAVLVLGYTLLRLLRKRLEIRKDAPSREPLKPRAPGRPVIRLYTLAGQDLSEDARRDLVALRDALGFEVDESPLRPGGTGQDERLLDHAPVAFLGGERLFNYQMDENVLRARLARLGQEKESA
ncbi:MAG TPA: VTT domain-containing protein [bacterium]|jgi:uncharacterized membrane protein YdjX (TVP38/TMEM64 family)|nr:VTT domain-containing protein [bacterium]